MSTLQLTIGDEGLGVTLDGVRVAGVSGVRIRANVAGFYEVDLELGAVRIQSGVLEALAGERAGVVADPGDA